MLNLQSIKVDLKKNHVPIFRSGSIFECGLKYN